MQYIAVAVIVVIAVAYLLRRYLPWGKSGKTDDLCSGCALKENCAKECVPKKGKKGGCGCC